jgi:mevalonate kinase
MAFAPGKLILLGEHAVVYGQPALAGAVDLGVEVTVRPGAGELCVPAWGLRVPAQPEQAAAAGSLAEAYPALRGALRRIPGWHDPAVDLEAHFELPTGAGLGSSAALSVAVARALAEAAKVVLDDQSLRDAAMAAETVFHGRPSGIDHAVSVAGGFGLYTRAGGLEPLDLAADESAIVDEPGAPAPWGTVPLVVAHTGKARDTRGRVARVAQLQAERPDEVNARFAAIGALVREAAAAIAKRDFPMLGRTMTDNQAHLEALEVSSDEIRTLCQVAHEAGALGAKLTGGGGGGCVIALHPGREDVLRERFEAAGFRAFITRVGGGRAAPRKQTA